MIIQGVTLNGVRVLDGGVMPTNLILYLDADNAASYSGSGTTVNDLSGNGYTHTLSNSNLYTELGGVKCFNCSSVGQVITSVSTTIQIPTNFTYISWVRVRASTTGFRTLLRSFDGGHAIIVNTGTNLLGMWDNTTETGFNSSGYNMSAYGDVWAQFATVGDASGQTFYINGQQVGSSVAKSVAGEYHFAWGNIQSANDQPWGYVANLELYNIKLTPEQLQQNYYGLRSRFSVQTFTATGNTTWTAPADVTSVEYLVVGGAGGGGQAADNAGAGGGGAGMVLTGNIAVAPGTTYTVTVGDGGAGGNSGSNVGAQNGSTGGSSVFATITALGGGGGFASRANQGVVGAAQITNTTAATGGGGGPGGGGGLGGGGAGGAGSPRSVTIGGAGGAGTSSTITGSSVTYGAGASGGNSGSQNGGTAGTSNTGNGGGGGGALSANYRAGGKGGSGIVVLKYGY
jgi:hypothetical protein